MPTYNIPALIKQTFGLSGPIAVPGPSLTNFVAGNPYPPAGPVTIPAQSVSGGVKVNPITPKGYRSPSLGQSYLGTPVYERLQIVQGGQVVFTFPDTTIVQASLPFIVEKTMIQGRKRGGSVKEFISEDDFRVRIIGLLINHESYDYPVDQVREFMENVRKGEAVEIQGMYLNDLGVNNLVFMNVDLKRERGEVSGRNFNVDPDQDILGTSQLNIEADVVPVGVGRKINVKLSFKNPFNT